MKTAFYNSAYGEQVATYFFDIMNSWPVILGSTGIALVLAYIFMLFMRCFGGIIVWAMIFILEAALIAGGGYCWYLRKDKYTEAD